MIEYPLRLGSVTFNQGPFEGPNGQEGGLGDLGIKQKAVVKEFPGGIITAQLYGDFPKAVIWSGKLFGSSAISRNLELRRLCKSGDLVTFSYADWQMEGFVEDLETHVKGPNEVDYKITFRPLEDQTNGGGGGLSPSGNNVLAGVLNNAQDTMLQQAASPAAGGTLPSTVQSGTSQLNKSINQALQQTGGGIANLSASSIQTLEGQIDALQEELTPLLQSADPILSSSAGDLHSTLGLIKSLISGTAQQEITTIKAVDPNLYQIAARFYGSPLLWSLVSQANGNIDPLSTTGEMDLVIPARPDLIPNSVPTVVRNGFAA